MVIIRAMTPQLTSLPTSIDARIAELAARQGNAFSRSQALETGASPSMIKRRIQTGRWGRPHPGVYTVAGSPPSWWQDVWTALLAVGPAAVVTHETALHVHGVHLVPRRPISLTIPHGGHSRVRDIVVHQIDDLRPHRRTTVGGLPVSTVERTVVELAATRRSRELARIVDETVVSKRTSYARIGACFAEVVRPGKPGMTKLARILDERGDGYVPAQSELERALFEALRAGGLPEPQRQLRLPGRGAIDGLVDAAYTDARLVLEADGRRWHTRIDQLKRDHQRDTEAARAGWLTLRFTYEQIVHQPEEVAAAVADVLAIRSRTPT